MDPRNVHHYDFRSGGRRVLASRSSFPILEAFPQFPNILPPSVEGEDPSLGESVVQELERSFRACEKRPRYTLLLDFPFSPRKPFPLLHAYPAFDLLLWAVWRQNIPGYRLKELDPLKTRLILDIGANVGMFSLYACKLFPRVKIIALEPQLANFRFLVDNIRRAGCASRVKPLMVGLSDRPQTLHIFSPNSIAAASVELRSKGSNSTGPVVPMRTISVEQLWGEAAKWVGLRPADVQVDYLKLDCEGCEYQALPGLRSFRSQIAQLVCETHPDVLLHRADRVQRNDFADAECKSGNKWGDLHLTLAGWEGPRRAGWRTIGEEKIGKIFGAIPEEVPGNGSILAADPRCGSEKVLTWCPELEAERCCGSYVGIETCSARPFNRNL